MGTTRRVRGAIVGTAATAAALTGGLVTAGPVAAAAVVVGPGQSIQAAVDAAASGDTITVRGTHHEGVVITKDRITLVGQGAVLEPPASPGVCGAVGICITNATGSPEDPPVVGVTVRGFTVRDFEDFGVFAFVSKDASIQANRLVDTGEYGVFANTSTGANISFNTTSGSEEAGIYVGDSPDANATVANNNSFDSEFGTFIRDAQGVKVTGNLLHDNCVGVLVLADAPGPAGNVQASGNLIRNNTKACPPSDDGPPASGIGFAIIGGHDVTISGNVITGNTASGPTLFSAGVAVVNGFGGTAPVDNVVRGNVIVNNGPPDVLWDGTGTGNSIQANVCRSSDPAGLCR